ncbi:MAG: alpha/beta fold hydrolase [Hyphomicrobiales bacterium]|nr:alpha/beta fold hydrolase [Hyphomicrobiales bacterium]
MGARIGAAIAFLRACFEKQPGEREFEIALAYNMLVPHEIRQALLTWKTDPAASASALAAVRVPALVVHGAADRVFLPGAARMTADAIPGARLSIFEDCGHSPFFEDAARFNRELADFVRAAWSAPRAN